MHHPVLIAHRGDRKYFPENTPAAFASAFAKGADGIELDVQLLGGKLCIVHDVQIDTSLEYPLLTDVIAEYGQQGRLEIEVKAFSEDVIPFLRQVIDDYRPRDVEVTTSVLPLVVPLVQAFPEIAVGAIFDSCHWCDWMTEETLLRKTTGIMQLMGARVAHIAAVPEEKLTPTLIAGLHAAGYIVHYHINQRAMQQQVHLYRLLSSFGVDQCTFDDIDLLRSGLPD